MSWHELDARIEKFQSDRKNHATTINVLAVALYRVFSRPANDDGTCTHTHTHTLMGCMSCK